MKIFSITSFLAIVLIVSAHAQAWTNYTNDRAIADILVDGKNVWVGSQGGLTRTNIDNGEFQTYLAGNSPIKGGGINEIEITRFGSLWFVSENAGIFNLTNGEWIHYDDGILSHPYTHIMNLQILTNGDVWALVENGDDSIEDQLVRIINGSVSFFDNLPANIKSIAVFDEQTIYIATSNVIHKYDVLSEQVVETFHSGNSIITATDNFQDITVHKNGTVIVSSRFRLLQIKNDVLSILVNTGIQPRKSFKDTYGNIYIQSDPTDQNLIRLIKYNGTSVSYYKDSDLTPYPLGFPEIPRYVGAGPDGSLYGVIWNMESEYVLYRFDGSDWSPVKTQIVPLLNNYQDDVQSDCHGNLWFSSRDGVDVRYADGTWEYFGIEVGQNYNFHAGAMAVDPLTCDVWFANIGNNGNAIIPGIIKISNGTITEFLYNHSNVHDLEATADGRIYFFSSLSKFGYIENDEVHLLDHYNAFEGAVSIDSDSKGSIYLASWDLGLIKYDGSSFSHLGTGEDGGYAFYVYVDNDDLVWVRTSSGIMMFDGINWHDYTDTWSSDYVDGMIQDKKGNYWVTTFNNGLFYWDKESTQQYTIFNSGLTTNSLRSVAFDPDGNLIVTQNVGVSVLEIPDIQGAYKGTGMVYFDRDKNGTFESPSDVPVPSQKVRDVDRDIWAITNPSGVYSFYSDTPEEHTYLHEIEVSAESTTINPQPASMPTYESNLPAFGFWKVYEDDIELAIANGTTVCNRKFKVQINLRNKSIESSIGNLTLQYNDIIDFVESSIPVSQQSAGELIFEDITLGALLGINVKITLQAPGLTNLEELFQFKADFETTDSLFSATTSDSLLCSYDPNDKKVEPTGASEGGFSLIADPIKYTIRFQNEGTYKAFDITIIDTLDSSLDPATFTFLGSSHDVTTRISGEGIVTFTFSNIDLPPKNEDELESQGFVSFSIMPDSDTENFEKVLNNASIYFDFNPPIVTNTTQWNLVDNFLILATEELNETIAIYPNPSDGNLIIAVEKPSTYHLMDITGKVLSNNTLQSGQNTLKFNVASGIYFLHVKDTFGKGLTEKLVIF